jgi:pyruvate dehydrogenase E1 component alpha subunit
MHVADFSIGILGANGVVADGVTIAAGAAHAVKLREEDRIVVAFFGDGAMNRGPMLESLNWASVFGLPLLFVCEDNTYSDHTRTASLTGGPGIVARAQAFGIPAERVDGNDVVAVYRAAERLVREVREQRTPRFLHATTYRWKGHLALDKGAYRDAGEVSRGMASDPIARARSWLVERGVPESALDADRTDAIDRVRSAVREAERADWPAPAALFDDVQDTLGPSPWS